MGFEDEMEQSEKLKNGLAVSLDVTVGPSRLTNSSHPSSREGHPALIPLRLPGSNGTR